MLNYLHPQGSEQDSRAVGGCSVSCCGAPRAPGLWICFVQDWRQDCSAYWLWNVLCSSARSTSWPSERESSQTSQVS